MAELEALVRTLNPLARTATATFGDAPLWTLMGDPDNKAPMAKLSVEGQVRGAVAAVKADSHSHDHDHGHGHGHSHGPGEDCAACEAEAKNRQDTTASRRFGIRSFVYNARKPFNADRLR